MLGGYAAMNVLRGGTAVSDEARRVRKAACELVERGESSQALFGKKAAALSRLARLTQECGDEGWDGAGGNALSAVAIDKTKAFLRALPDSIPLPEFAAEPDGSVSLDWIESRRRLFSLSVGNSDRLAYAWLDGADKGHAVARFDGTTVPSLILEGIKSILNHGHAPLQVA